MKPSCLASLKSLGVVEFEVTTVDIEELDCRKLWLDGLLVVVNKSAKLYGDFVVDIGLNDR